MHSVVAAAMIVTTLAEIVAEFAVAESGRFPSWMFPCSFLYTFPLVNTTYFLKKLCNDTGLGLGIGLVIFCIKVVVVRGEVPREGEGNLE